MAHLVPPSEPGRLARLVYWMSRRRLGQVATPVGVMAHDPRTLAAYCGFEAVFEHAQATDKRLKALAELRVATMVGCPF